MKKRSNMILAVMLILIAALSGCFKGSSSAEKGTMQATAARESIAPSSAEPESTAPATETAESTGNEAASTGAEASESEAARIAEDGKYTSKDDVALYLHTYGKLPSNFITKKEAESKGWTAGDLWKYAKGCSIGGSSFGNYEKLLPEKKGRKYFECDIDYNGGKRNAKRIVYSNDGLIYYTEDHYESFELLYGKE